MTSVAYEQSLRDARQNGAATAVRDYNVDESLTEDEVAEEAEAEWYTENDDALDTEENRQALEAYCDAFVDGYRAVMVELRPDAPSAKEPS